MGDSFVRRKVDFVFDLSSSNSSAGNEIYAGLDDNYYYEADDKEYPGAYELDNQSCMEIEGIELLGGTDGTRRVPLQYIRLEIGGNTKDAITLNELMTPAYMAGTRNLVNDFRDGNVCINLGRGMLAGGSAWEATPKVGPLQTLNVKVGFPTTSQGGDATIEHPLRVRPAYNRGPWKQQAPAAYGHERSSDTGRKVRPDLPDG